MRLCSHTEAVFTILVMGTVTSATVTSSICASDLCIALVPMTIASDLSGFRQRPLASSQRLKAVVNGGEGAVSAESDA